MNNQKSHFKIYVRDEDNNFTIPLYKDGRVLVFSTLADANNYAQKEAGFKLDYKIK